MQDRIGEYRKKELAKLRTQERYIAGNRFSFFSIPIITALATFISYSLLGGEMSAEKVFTSMALFNIMQVKHRHPHLHTNPPHWARFMSAMTH